MLFPPQEQWPRQEQHPTGRLPSYRASYMRRFHPYPRSYPSRRDEDFMTTIDHGFNEPPPGLALPPKITTASSSGTAHEDEPSDPDAPATTNAESPLAIPRIEITDVDASFSLPPSPTQPSTRTRCRRFLRAAAVLLARPIAALMRMCRGARRVQDAEEAIEFEVIASP